MRWTDLAVLVFVLAALVIAAWLLIGVATRPVP